VKFMDGPRNRCSLAQLAGAGGNTLLLKAAIVLIASGRVKKNVREAQKVPQTPAKLGVSLGVSLPDITPSLASLFCEFACSALRFVAKCFHLPVAVGRQSARSPAACPDGILKNSNAGPSL